MPVIIFFFKKLWREVTQKLPTQKRSRLVAEVEDGELHSEHLEQLERLIQFQGKMHQKYGELPNSAQYIQDMREQRDDEISLSGHSPNTMNPET